MVDIDAVKPPRGTVDEAAIERLRWIAACVGGLLEACPTIDPDDATRMARAMWAHPRFRERGPRAMADFLLSNSAVRPGSATAADSGTPAAGKSG